MPELHPDYEAVLEEVEELNAYRREVQAKGDTVVPFGMEKVPASELKSRIETDNRMAGVIARKEGTEATLDLLREGRP